MVPYRRVIAVALEARPSAAKRSFLGACEPSLPGVNRFDRAPITSGLPLPAQPVDATQALNLSAGVSNCKVSRGRSYDLRATCRPRACECTATPAPLQT